MKPRKSNVVDTIVKADDGATYRGYITKEIAASSRGHSGPIVLLRGADWGNGSGYGKTHLDINESRVRRFRSLGFAGVNDVVSAVCGGFDEVRVQEKGRLALTMTTCSTAITAWVQYISPPGYWSVVTLVPKSLRRPDPCWKK